MLQSVPIRGAGKPRLLCHLRCLTPITFQVIGPNTLFISDIDVALMSTDDAAQLIDAIQINQASGQVTLWMKGDVWAAGSANFNAVVYIPGNNAGSGLEVNDQANSSGGQL